MQLVDRKEFWSLVVQNGTTKCWACLGEWGPDQRPVFRGERAYRAAFIDRYGEIPKGCAIHHQCENSSCVNPRHLLAVPPDIHDRLHKLSRVGDKRSYAEICRKLRQESAGPAQPKGEGPRYYWLLWGPKIPRSNGPLRKGNAMHWSVACNQMRITEDDRFLMLCQDPTLKCVMGFGSILGPPDLGQFELLEEWSLFAPIKFEQRVDPFNPKSEVSVMK